MAGGYLLCAGPVLRCLPIHPIFDSLIPGWQCLIDLLFLLVAEWAGAGRPRYVTRVDQGSEMYKSVMQDAYTRYRPRHIYPNRIQIWILYIDNQWDKS